MSRDRNGIPLEAVRSRYWRADDAERVLRVLEASQLSVAAFSRQHGLSTARLLRWKKRLGKRGSGSGPFRRSSSVRPRTPLQFHSVRVVTSSPAPPSSQQESGVELLLLGDRRIVVRRGFDPELLAELVRVVESWPRC